MISLIHISLVSVDPIVKDILRTYNDDFSLVQRKYQQYSSGEAYVRMLVERPIIVQSSQRQVYEVEAERPIGRSVSTAGEEQVWYIATSFHSPPDALKIKNM